MPKFCCNYNGTEDLFFTLDSDGTFDVSYSTLLQTIMNMISVKPAMKLYLSLIDEDDVIYKISDDASLAKAVKRALEISGVDATLQLYLNGDEVNMNGALNTGNIGTTLKLKRTTSSSAPNSPKASSHTFLNLQGAHSQSTNKPIATDNLEAPSFASLLPLISEFISNSTVQQALSRVAPLAAASLKSGTSIPSVIANVLSLEPVLSHSDLIVKLLPFMPSYYAKLSLVRATICELLVRLPSMLPILPQLFSLFSPFVSSGGLDPSHLENISPASLASLPPDTGLLLSSLSSLFTGMVVDESKAPIVEEPAVHSGYTCGFCHVSPISGVRYFCPTCQLSLCEICEGNNGGGKHDESHEITKVKRGNIKKRERDYVGEMKDMVDDNGRPFVTAPILFSSCFIDHVSVPSGSVLPPGQVTIKTWRLHNDGAHSWPQGTRVVEIRGDKLTNTRDLFPVIPIAAGESIDVSVMFETPPVPGSYTAYYSLIDQNKRHFGEVFEIDIIVVDETEGVDTFVNPETFEEDNASEMEDQS